MHATVGCPARSSISGRVGLANGRQAAFAWVRRTTVSMTRSSQVVKPLLDGLRQSSRHACRGIGSPLVSTGTAKYESPNRHTQTYTPSFSRMKKTRCSSPSAIQEPSST
jgi:hypothetical protein